MSVETAFQKAIETLIHWISSQVNMNKTQVLFRTYAPVHFRFIQLSSLPFVQNKFFLIVSLSSPS